ncbi:hypothetical protein VCHENC02_5007, partial [Vibrio harveyi]
MNVSSDEFAYKVLKTMIE